MVSTMPAIRPSQFSALKTLDPLDQEDEDGEDDDRQADIQQVVHGYSVIVGPLDVLGRYE